MSSIQVLDVYYDNRVDFDQEVATGTDGFLFKLGQGQYQEYLAKKCNFAEEAKRVGKPHGFFWQMDARYSPESHKAAIKESLTALGGPGPLSLWLAVELPFYPCPNWLYAKLPYAWYKPIESVWRGVYAAFGFYPDFYSNAVRWAQIMGKCPIPLQQEMAEKSKLWVAQYKIDKPDPVGAWGDNYALWQYTEQPDYSVVRDEAWWAKVAGVTPAPQPVPVPVPSPINQHIHLEKIITVDIDTLDANTGVTVGLR